MLLVRLEPLPVYFALPKVSKFLKPSLILLMNLLHISKRTMESA